MLSSAVRWMPRERAYRRCAAHARCAHDIAAAPQAAHQVLLHHHVEGSQQGSIQQREGALCKVDVRIGAKDIGHAQVRVQHGTTAEPTSKTCRHLSAPCGSPGGRGVASSMHMQRGSASSAIYRRGLGCQSHSVEAQCAQIGGRLSRKSAIVRSAGSLAAAMVLYPQQQEDGVRLLWSARLRRKSSSTPACSRSPP